MFSKEKGFITLKLLSRGRIGRIQYFLSTLGIAFIGITLALLLSVIPTIGITLAVVYLLGATALNLIYTAQRCHDLNLSGWYSLFALIPPASIYFYFASGTEGKNLYGREPSPCCAEARVATIFLSALLVVGSVATITLYSHSQINGLDVSIVASR